MITGGIFQTNCGTSRYSYTLVLTRVYRIDTKHSRRNTQQHLNTVTSADTRGAVDDWSQDAVVDKTLPYYPP